jgi:hypothetical protein
MIFLISYYMITTTNYLKSNPIKMFLTKNMRLRKIGNPKIIISRKY